MSVELEGSARSAPEEAEDQGAVEDGAQLSVTVYLRPNPDAQKPFDVVEEALKPPSQRRYLSADEARQVYGASDADIEAVKAFAASQGLEVERVNQAARSVKLSGTAAAIRSAFGVELRRYSAHGVTYRSYTGHVQVPADLESVVQAVVGLDNRPLGRGRLRFADDQLQAAIRQGRASGALPANTYLPPQVGALYQFPDHDAGGQTVAVFAFNGPIGEGEQSAPGGYDATILDQYFTQNLGLTPPTITDVTVQGPGNDPGDGSNPNDSSPEVYLDLSIVGSLATGAKIVMYFTEFTEQGWVDGLSEATTDTTNNPSVISISYGNPESGTDSAWTSAAVKQVNISLEAAASRGMSVTVAAGDDGASDGESSGVHVDFPASSPWVLACGGTRLEASGDTISSEVVWNDQTTNPQTSYGATGGGVSVVFPLPSWQTNAGVPPVAGTSTTGRGVPDVSALADPETPFVVAQPGGPAGVGGTSAAAPLWASLLARYNASLSARVGFLNPRLYTLPAGTLRDIVSGNNKAPGGPGYDAGPGWDACTGFGSPGGSSLLSGLQ
jgi:kumamolisin